MKELIKNQLKMALMVGPMNELEARLDRTLEDLFPDAGHRVTEVITKFKLTNFDVV